MVHIVFYTDWFVPTRFDGVTYGPVIFLRQKCKSDPGILHHELVHVAQFWHNPLFGLWYWLSKKSRFEYEVAAYREQLEYYSDDRTEKFANLLVRNYDLGITIAEAKAALK